MIHEREIKVSPEESNICAVAYGMTPDEMFLLERQDKLVKGDQIGHGLIDPQCAFESLKLYAD